MSTNSKTYGILVIGCGHIGCQHLEDIYFRDDINIVAVVDANIELAKLAAKKYNAKYFSDNYKEFLTNPEIDIVIVATYTDSHLAITKECAQNGKHVLCEKPIATNKQDGDDFIDLINSSNVKIQIAHILRHNETYKKIREIILSGQIGEIELIRMVQNHNTKNWERYCRLLSDCMPAIDCGVHYYDVIRWLTDCEFTEVSGYGAKLDADSPTLNFNVVNFKLNNGCVGYYEVGWGKNLSAESVKEFIGTKGRITLVMQDQRGADSIDGDAIHIFKQDSNEETIVNVKCAYKNMYAQLKSLINSIENDVEPTPSTFDVKKAFDIALAAKDAITSGTTITLN